MNEHLIIIPTYNEAGNIARIIEKVFSLDLPFHLLIIDDGSPDGTGDIVKKYQQQFPERLFLLARPGKMGLGTAYIKGFKWAIDRQYEYIYEMDADFSHNPDDLLRLHSTIISNVQHGMAIGSRYIKGGGLVNWPISRILMSKGASLYVRLITGIPVKDTTAGFVCIRRTVLEKLDLEKIKFLGYAFQIEMKYAIWKQGFTLVEVPIIFTDRTIGVSKMNTGIFKEAFRGVLKMSRNGADYYVKN